MSRPVLAAAVALLATTAGCGGVLGGGTRTPYDVAPSPTPTPTPTAATATARATPTPRAPPALAAVLSDQDARLRNLSSYTLRSNWTVTSGGETTDGRNFTFRVDRAADRGIQYGRIRRQEGTSPVDTVEYRGEGIGWVERTGPDGESEYRNVTGEGDGIAEETVALFRTLSDRVARADLRRNGTATFAGEEMTRYTATGVDAAPAPDEDLVAYRMTVLVDGGLIRSVEVTVVERPGGGRTYTTRQRVTLTGIGSTSVERPAWVGTGVTESDAGPPREVAEVLDTQALRLERAESYTLTVSVTTTVSGEVESFRNWTYRVNRSQGRALTDARFLEARRSNASDLVVYRGDGIFVSRRVSVGGNVVVRNLTSGYDDPANASARFFGSETDELARIDLERNGSVEFDGNLMPRYTAAGVDVAPPSTGDIADYRTTVYVDDGGLVRLIETERIERTGSEAGPRIVTRIRFELTGLAETTVERPEWVDDTTTTNATTTATNSTTTTNATTAATNATTTATAPV